MKNTKYISVEQVLAIHDAVLRYGGAEGPGHRGEAYEGVEAAVYAVRNSYYESVYELAAAYAVYIVEGHVFLDGNKRTASHVMLDFLRANRAHTSISAEQAARLMIDLQKRVESREEGTLVNWVASKLRVRKRR